MTSLLEEIRRINGEAADKLETAEYRTDSQIKSLGRQDLLELLPGDRKLRLRKQVYEVICRSSTEKTSQTSIDGVLSDLKGFVPDDSCRDLLSENGSLLDYLKILNKIRHDLSKVQDFLDAHSNLLERLRKKVTDKQNEGNLPEVSEPPSVNDASVAATSSSSNKNLLTYFTSFFTQDSDSRNHAPERRDSNIGRGRANFVVTVTYRMVVCGKTLNAHLDMLKNLNGPVPGPEAVSLHLTEAQHEEESRVTIVFCPIVSRVGTDTEAALRDISIVKPVILVAMYHLHTPTSYPAPGSSNVTLGVNVFFHETKNGLLNCTQNDDAINMIKRKLLEYSSKKSRRN